MKSQKMRKLIASNAHVFKRIERVEQKQFEADRKFEQVFKAIEDKSLPQTRASSLTDKFLMHMCLLPI